MEYIDVAPACVHSTDDTADLRFSGASSPCRLEKRRYVHEWIYRRSASTHLDLGNLDARCSVLVGMFAGYSLLDRISFA
jgi:hypothetical protein